MNESMRNYYILNQFLCGAKYNSLPEGLVPATHEKELSKLWKRGHAIKPVLLTALEKVFLNLLRIPDYGLCVTQEGRILSIAKVAATCREQDYEVSDCSHWAERLVRNVETLSEIAPATVRDGELYISRDVLSRVNAVDAMNKAFALYVWGTLTPTAKSKLAVKQLIALSYPEGNVSLTMSEVLDLMTLIVESSLSVETLRSSVLQIHDLSHMYQLAGVLAWWDTPAQTRVSVLLPRGNNNRMAHVQMSADEFFNICAADITAAQGMIVRGDRIMFADQK